MCQLMAGGHLAFAVGMTDAAASVQGKGNKAIAHVALVICCCHLQSPESRRCAPKLPLMCSNLV